MQKVSQINDVSLLAEIRDTVDVLSPEWQEAEDKLRGILKTKYEDEHILVINQEFMPDFIEEGFTPVNGVIANATMESLAHHAIFMPRHQMEYNPTFKQFIPYVVGVTSDKEVFSMLRRPASGEARLVGQISLGIGGHINPVDEEREDMDVIMAGLQRELFEEVNIGDGTEGRLVFKGFIYDPSNVVGKDHLGLAYVLELSNKDISIKETDKLIGKFMTKEELTSPDNELESWSKIVVDNIL